MVSGENDAKWPKLEEVDINSDDSVNNVDGEGYALTIAKMIENVNKTKMEIRKKLLLKYRLKAQKLVNKAKKNYHRFKPQYEVK